MARGSMWKFSLAVLAVLAMSAFSSQVAYAQTARGGEWKCANNLPDDVVGTASFIWTQGGVDIGVTQVFTCDANSATPTVASDNQTVDQPAGADGWRLSVTYTGLFGTQTLPDVSATFVAGEFPRIRERLGSPVGGTATFVLSRNP